MYRFLYFCILLKINITEERTMSTRNLSRITIDIRKEFHKKLKTRAAILGKSMRELVIEALELSQECLNSDHMPNKITIKAIKDAEKGKGLIRGKEAEKLTKKLGLKSARTHLLETFYKRY